jgi:putative ABC transport system substrate-binding protein
MQRRQFIVGLAGATMGPLAAQGQQPVPVVGFLSGGTSDAFGSYAAAFRKGLAETAYTDGWNVTFAYRWAEGQADRLPELAAGLVAARVAVIATAGGMEAAQSARAATTLLPIVFVGNGDPVKAGLVRSLARPSGNVTGVAVATNGIGTRRLGLLVQFVPRAQTIGFLANPDNPGADAEWRDIQDAARLRGKQTLIVKAGSAADLEPAFAALVRQRAGAKRWWPSRRATLCPRCTLRTRPSPPAASSPTAPTSPTPTARAGSTAGGFSPARSPPSCR